MPGRAISRVRTVAAVCAWLATASSEAQLADSGRPTHLRLDDTLPFPTEGWFEVVGHEPLLARGMNAAPAVHGNYVYVGSRTDGSHPNAGVLVVDVSDPSTPRVVHQIGPPLEGNLGESSRELRVWSTQNLLLVLTFACTGWLHACQETSPSPRISFYDIAGELAARPRHLVTYYPIRTPHEFYLWEDPVRPGRALLYMSTPSLVNDNLLVADISNARGGQVRQLLSWDPRIPPDPGADSRLHSLSVSVDGRRGYLAYLGSGFLVIDTSALADNQTPQITTITDIPSRPRWGNPGAHSAVKLFGQNFALITDEVYGSYLPGQGCPWGWVRLIDIADPVRPTIASELRIWPYNYATYCPGAPPIRLQFSSFSSHNPTLTRDLALVTWHSAGLVAFSLTHPRIPRLVAQFVPEPLPAVQTEDPALSSGIDKVVLWSYPIIKDGLIYVVDIRNGLYILRYHGPHEDQIARIRFLEGNSNLGDAMQMDR